MSLSSKTHSRVRHVRECASNVALITLAMACGGDKKASGDSSTASNAAAPAACTSDSAATGIVVPAGFCATIFADTVGHARHIVLTPNGDVYVNTWSGAYYPKAPPPSGGFLVAMRDTNRDGRADIIQRFGDSPATKGTGGVGIALYKGAIYAEETGRILRFPMDSSLAPNAKPDTVVTGLPMDGDHFQHAIAIDSSGALYMESGSASNACQIKERTEGSKGKDPCKETDTRGGVWRYDANAKMQAFSPKERYATGIRNAVGMTIGPDNALWTTQHGRDQLAENWPKLYTPEQGQNLPAEEFMRVSQGDDFGWPYCYYDATQKKLLLAPEYGGDGGKTVGRCEGKKAPVAAFPAHWAPNGSVFYSASQFPAKYHGGVFIAFHGSWNRAPGPQGGYNVVFQPMSGGNASGDYEIFAHGFAGATAQPDRATYRPAGVAVGSDGALYVTDDVKGRIWRITYTGK